MFCREPPQGLSWPRSGRVVCSSTTQSAPCRSGFLAKTKFYILEFVMKKESCVNLKAL